MNAALRGELLALRERDLSVRAELEADGSLYDGYHPRMEAVHRANAERLRRIVSEVGWPHEGLVGAEGAEAAWLVAQHSISEPDFMRRCRDELERESAAGRVPRWQYAYLDDRIRVSEGRPQRFGTQLELKPDGPAPCEIEDPGHLDELRREAGLPSLEERLRAMAAQPRPTALELAARKAAEERWRRRVGWSVARDA